MIGQFTSKHGVARITGSVRMQTRTKVILGGLAAGAALGPVAAGVATALAGRFLLRRLRRHENGDLRGQTVLVTGSSRGLGLALAEEFAREGCRLVLCSRHRHALARAWRRTEDPSE